MDDTLLQTIKEAVPKDSWLELLDDAQLLKIHAMLKNGSTSSEIIKTCQSMFNIKRRAKLQELLPDLVKFRTKSLDDKALLKLEETQQNEAAIQLSNRLRGLTSKVDALGRLNWLVDQQTHRVLRMLDKENKTTLMYPGTTENLTILEKMLHNLRKAQLELRGDEDSGKITPEAHEKLQGLVEGFKDDGETMIQATRKLLELAETRSLTLKLNDEGKYSISSNKPKKEEEVEVVEVVN